MTGWVVHPLTGTLRPSSGDAVHEAADGAHPTLATPAVDDTPARSTPDRIDDTATTGALALRSPAQRTCTGCCRPASSPRQSGRDPAGSCAARTRSAPPPARGSSDPNRTTTPGNCTNDRTPVATAVREATRTRSKKRRMAWNEYAEDLIWLALFVLPGVLLGRRRHRLRDRGSAPASHQRSRHVRPPGRPQDQTDRQAE